ncbi:Gp49 family protein, partial [Clostridium perfringens]
DDNKNLASGVSIGSKMVDGFIKEVHVSTLGDKTTLVRAILVNGFEIVESTGCVDKVNYSEDIGAEICLNKIKDKIWYLLGFLLQTAYNGVN